MGHICQLMIGSFQGKWGRYPEEITDLQGGPAAFDDMNLQSGIAYSEGLIEEGHVHCPINGYDLEGFIKWAKKHLGDSSINT